MHVTRAAMKGMAPRGFSARAMMLAWCVALVASQAFAAEWPEGSKNWFARGPGGGISVLLVSLWWLWIPLWAGCSSWVAKDLGRWNLSAAVWPSVMVFPFFVAAMAAWWIPSAIAGLAIMGVAWAVPTFTYVIVRNGRAPNHEKVLTPGHILDCFADALRPMGIKIKRPPKEVKDSLPVVQLADAAGKPVLATSEDEAQAHDEGIGHQITLIWKWFMCGVILASFERIIALTYKSEPEFAFDRVYSTLMSSLLQEPSLALTLILKYVLPSFLIIV